MRIQQRKKGNIAILELHGELGIGTACTRLRERFAQLREEGERLFVFDMTGVPWIDTAGVCECIVCHKRLREADGEIRLVLKGKAHDLFVMWELHKVFRIYEDLEEALASFAVTREPALAAEREG